MFSDAFLPLSVLGYGQRRHPQRVAAVAALHQAADGSLKLMTVPTAWHKRDTGASRRAR